MGTVGEAEGTAGSHRGQVWYFLLQPGSSSWDEWDDVIVQGEVPTFLGSMVTKKHSRPTCPPPWSFQPLLGTVQRIMRIIAQVGLGMGEVPEM